MREYGASEDFLLSVFDEAGSVLREEGVMLHKVPDLFIVRPAEIPGMPGIWVTWRFLLPRAEVREIENKVVERLINKFESLPVWFSLGFGVADLVAEHQDVTENR